MCILRDNETWEWSPIMVGEGFKVGKTTLPSPQDDINIENKKVPVYNISRKECD